MGFAESATSAVSSAVGPTPANSVRKNLAAVEGQADEARKIVKTFCHVRKSGQKLAANKYCQFGGNETLGQGWFQLTLANYAAAGGGNA